MCMNVVKTTKVYADVSDKQQLCHSYSYVHITNYASIAFRTTINITLRRVEFVLVCVEM